MYAIRSYYAREVLMATTSGTARPKACGQANKELIAFFSKLLKVPKSRVEICSGESSRLKRIFIGDLSSDDIHHLFVAGGRKPEQLDLSLPHQVEAVCFVASYNFV